MLRAGIHLDADAVRVCAVELGDDGPQWRASAIEDLPSGAVVEGMVRDGGVVVAAMGRAMEGLEPDVVALGYAGNDAISKTIAIPAMTPAELDEQIKWEADQHIPFDPKACAVEYRVVGEHRERGQMTVSLTAMRNETFEALVALTREAGITLGAVELLEEALLRVLRLAPPAGAHAVIGALADAVLTVVAVDGELVLAREGDVRRVVDFAAAASDVTPTAATLLGPRAKAMVDTVRSDLEIPVAVWTPPPARPGLKPISAELSVAFGLALPGPATHRVGAPRKRGLWARLFG